MVYTVPWELLTLIEYPFDILSMIVSSQFINWFETIIDIWICVYSVFMIYIFSIDLFDSLIYICLMIDRKSIKLNIRNGKSIGKPLTLDRMIYKLKLTYSKLYLDKWQNNINFSLILFTKFNICLCIDYILALMDA